MDPYDRFLGLDTDGPDLDEASALSDDLATDSEEADDHVASDEE